MRFPGPTTEAPSLHMRSSVFGTRLQITNYKALIAIYNLRVDRLQVLRMPYPDIIFNMVSRRRRARGVNERVLVVGVADVKGSEPENSTRLGESVGPCRTPLRAQVNATPPTMALAAFRWVQGDRHLRATHLLSRQESYAPFPVFKVLGPPCIGWPQCQALSCAGLEMPVSCSAQTDCLLSASSCYLRANVTSPAAYIASGDPAVTYGAGFVVSLALLPRFGAPMHWQREGKRVVRVAGMLGVSRGCTRTGSPQSIHGQQEGAGWFRTYQSCGLWMLCRRFACVTSGPFMPSLRADKGNLQYLQWYDQSCNECGGKNGALCMHSTQAGVVACSTPLDNCTCTVSGVTNSSCSLDDARFDV